LNHTVCMSADGNTTWSFGDGDYGKLGLGNSTAKATPAKVEALLGLGVKKVACGTQFTVALTRDGKVLTWGQGTVLLVVCRTTNIIQMMHSCECNTEGPVWVPGL